MSFESSAQFLEVVEQPDIKEHLIVLEPVQQPMEVFSPNSIEEPLVITEPEKPIEVELIVDELPGAPPGTKDPEPELVVEEEVEKVEADENDAETKKNEKWNWSKKGPDGFIEWIKERLESVPKHSGQDSAGLERAISYLERLDNEISKAMRLDLDGELDANKIEDVRSKIDDGIARLNDRLDKVKKNKKTKRKKSADFDPALVKQAQKITGSKGVFVTVPLLISGIARVCINSCVSAGHDLERVYKEQVNKYKLNDRERSEVKWLLFDMGFPIRGDRGFMLDDEEYNTSDNNGFDYMANYQS